MVHRTMALMARTSLAAEGRGEAALAEHTAIVDAIAARDGDLAAEALRAHLSTAFEVRLREEARGL
jgi:DNA-binding GntR family transcriptional regulator